MLKTTLTIIANVGGIIAILRLLIDIYNHKVTIRASLMDCYKTEGGIPYNLNFVHITLSNLSYRPISIIDMEVSSKSGYNSLSFSLSRNKIFIYNKRYEDEYKYPLFTTPLPVNLPPKSSVDVLVEVIDFKNNDFRILDHLSVVTDKRTKTTKLNQSNMKLVNQYQFR